MPTVTAVAAVASSVSFQSTRPMRGATTVWAEKTGRIGISIHAPLAGRDDPSNAILALHLHFNPRAPRGARRQLANQSAKRSIISIHAPHAGRDGAGVRVYRNYPGISIHAPHAGRDDRGVMQWHKSTLFQSTRPMRGATAARYLDLGADRHGRRGRRKLGLISIHAPHAGRDDKLKKKRADLDEFQSTRPMRGATSSRRSTAWRISYFNPRAPCGARLHQLRPAQKAS